MSRGRPFLFCRYRITFDDEPLSERAELTLLKERQGQRVPHRKQADWEGEPDTLLMRPRKRAVDDYSMHTWSVGHIVDQRYLARYDRQTDRLRFETVPDGSVRYADFVSVPALGALAVDDRTGDLHMGGRQAINRLRSVIRATEGADIKVQFYASSADVDRALRQWGLTRAC
jgi:hypothetical protein